MSSLIPSYHCGEPADDKGGFTEFLGPIGIGMLVLFGLCCFKSCQEIDYQRNGKQADATVSHIEKEYDRYGRQTGYKVWYSFRNANTRQAVQGYEIIRISEVGQYSVGQPLRIEYFGDEIFSCRIAGTPGLFWKILYLLPPIVTILGVIATLVYVVRGGLVKE